MKRMPLIASLFLVLVSQPAIADLTATRQAELMYLLKQDCGSCHGLTMKGGLGPALLPETLTGKPRDFLVNTILAGRSGTAMPPWDSMLSLDEATWLTDQLMRGIN